MIIEIEILTPVHIGTGQKMAPNAGFVHFPQENRVAVLDEEKVLGVVGAGQIQTWVGLIHKNESLYRWLTEGRPALRATDVARRTLKTRGSLGNTQEFRPMMHTGVAGERPYIPGSSLKGAVRTALFAAAVRSWGQHLREFPQNDRISGKFSAESMTKSVFGKDPNHDYLRLLHVGDAHFEAGSTECLKAEVLNQGLNSFHLKIPHLLEVLPVGATATATWQLVESLAQRQPQRQLLKPPPALADFGALLTALNAHTRRLVQTELGRLPARENDAYRDELKKLAAACEKCRDGQEAVLRVGFGSGHPAMTGDWLSEEKNRVVGDAVRRGKYAEFPFPKSRKLVPGADGAVSTPMGFVKLTLLTAEQQAARAADALRNAAEQAIQTAKDNAEAAQRAVQAAAEALRRAEAARVPEYFTGKLKDGVTVDAIYVGPEAVNRQMRVFRLLLEAPGKEVKLSVKIGDFPHPPNTLMRVTIKTVTKKGLPESIQTSPLPQPKIAR